jgi:hypothetical protein
MAGFVRATRNNQFNESTQQLISEGISHYNSLRETLQKLSGKKGYNTYFESYTPTLTEDTMDATELTERFMSSSLDPRIESAMPILAKLSKKISEMSEVQQLEEWSDTIVDESIYTNVDPQVRRLAGALSKKLSVGVDAINAKEILSDLGVRDNELNLELEKLAGKNPDADVADDVLDWMAQSDNHMYHKVVSKVRKSQQPEPAPVQQQAPVQQAPAPQQQAPVQQESLRPGERHHFETDPETGKRVYKGIRGDRTDAPKRRDSSGDASERHDSDRKAHIQHDRKMTEEGLDSDQKAAGQLGPTEKVKNNNIGKLVGASESTDPLIRMRKLSGLNKQ